MAIALGYHLKAKTIITTMPQLGLNHCLPDLKGAMNPILNSHYSNVTSVLEAHQNIGALLEEALDGGARYIHFYPSKSDTHIIQLSFAAKIKDSDQVAIVARDGDKHEIRCHPLFAKPLIRFLCFVNYKPSLLARELQGGAL